MLKNQPKKKYEIAEAIMGAFIFNSFTNLVFNKKKYILFILLFSSIHYFSYSQTENVGIGTSTNPSFPDNSALLDLDVSNMTTKRGFLTPRITTAERNAISSPANGLLIYNTDLAAFEYYINPTGWTTLAIASSNISFDLITSATNTGQALNVGDLSVLAPSGTGIIRANEFVGTGSTTGAIDLNSDETNGILPINKGGTNSSTALNNDRIMVSQAGSIVEAAALTDGQFLIGQTGGAPVAATITAGSNITVTPGPGSLEIAFSGSALPAIGNSQIWIGDATGTAQAQTVSGDLTLANNGVATVTGLRGRPIANSFLFDGQILKWNSFAFEWQTAYAVASVGLSMPGQFTVAGSPITNTGTFNVNWSNQTAGTVLAAPENTDGVPSFRYLVDSDIPDNITVSNYLSLDSGSTHNTLRFDATDGWKATDFITNTGTWAGVGLTASTTDSTIFETLGDVKIDGDLIVTGEIDPISLTLQPQTTPPAGVTGKLYYNANTNKLNIYTGSQYDEVGSTGGGSSPWTISGSDIYRNIGMVIVGDETQSPIGTPALFVSDGLFEVINSNANNVLFMDNTNYGTTTLLMYNQSYQSLLFKHSSNASTQNLINDENSNAIINRAAGAILTYAPTPLYFGTNNQVRLSVLGTGEVLVNSTQTGLGYKFYVNGNARVNDAFTADSSVTTPLVKFDPQTTEPDYTEGAVYYNDTDNELKLGTGGTYQSLGGSSTPYFGEMYYSGTSSIVALTTQNTYYGFADMTQGEVNNVTFTDNATADRLTIPSNGAGKYQVNVTVTYSLSRTDVLETAIFQNGSIVSKLSILQENGSNGEIVTTSFSGILSCAASDYIDIRFANIEANSTNLTIRKLNVNINKIGN